MYVTSSSLRSNTAQSSIRPIKKDVSDPTVKTCYDRSLSTSLGLSRRTPNKFVKYNKDIEAAEPDSNKAGSKKLNSKVEMTKKKSESSLIKVHSRFKMHDNAHFTPLISEFELMTLMYKEDTDLSFITKLLTSNYSIVDIPLTSYVPIIDSSELSQVAGNLGQFEFLPTQGISQKYSRSKIIDLNKLREYAKQEIIILKQKEYIQKIRDAQAKTRRTPTQDKTIRVLDTMRSDPSESKDDRIPSFKEFTRFIKGLSDTRDGLTKNLLVSPNKTERRYLSPQPLKFSKNVNNHPMSFEQLKIFVEHNIKKFRVKGTMLQFPINEERVREARRCFNGSTPDFNTLFRYLNLLIVLLSYQYRLAKFKNYQKWRTMTKQPLQFQLSSRGKLSKFKLAHKFANMRKRTFSRNLTIAKKITIS